MSGGIDIAQAAQHRLQGHEGTLDQAVARLEGLDGRKGDLIEAIAYLACQVSAYRAISNEDASLAITQVRTIVRNYDERRKAVES